MHTQKHREELLLKKKKKISYRERTTIVDKRELLEKILELDTVMTQNLFSWITKKLGSCF